MDVLVVEGTVRNGRWSIHAAREAVRRFEAAGHEAELFDPAERDVPLLRTRTYTGADEPPDDVRYFADRVEACDLLVLVSPEYNHSYPGCLKNLVDHLYPEYDGVPFAYVTVSAGGFGGVRCMEDLESLTVTLGGHPGPGLPVSNVRDVFDEDGTLQDDEYGERFDDWVEKAEAHAERFG